MRLHVHGLLSLVVPLAVVATALDTNTNHQGFLRVHDGTYTYTYLVPAIDWTTIATHTITSNTTATLQVVANPTLNKKTSPIAVTLLENLHRLQADLVRYVPWFPYPLLAVAELEPPNYSTRTTSWNFTDEMQQEFLDTFRAVTSFGNGTSNSNGNKQKKNRVVINFSTQPTWMFDTQDWSYDHHNPNHAMWGYPRGKWNNKTTTKLVADYYGRLASWIVKGNFQDEFNNTIGGGPALGHQVTHWEVFNEPDAEHSLTPHQYTELFDAVVRAIRQAVDPHHHNIQFMGMALASHNQWDWYSTFLNLDNHAPDVRDAVINGYASFHWYGSPSSRTNVSTFMRPFEQMQGFLKEVDAIVALRNQYSPTTRLAVNEAGVIPPNDNHVGADPLPPIYFNMAAAVYTVLVSELTLKGVDVVGSSQFAGCTENPLWDIPDRQYPGVSMTNWTTGHGNPRYWALKLYLQYFAPGDKIVYTSTATSSNSVQNKKKNQHVFVQARLTAKHKKQTIIVVNKTDKKQSIKFSRSTCNLEGAKLSVVDETTHDGPWKVRVVHKSQRIKLKPFAVAVLELNKGNNNSYE